MENPENNNSDNGEIICPFLGARDDPETRYAYLSSGNHCYRVNPIGSIAFEHQEIYCLTANYSTCPIFKKEWEGPLPPGIRSGEDDTSGVNTNQRRYGVIIILLLLFAAVISIAWYLFSQGLLDNILGSSGNVQQTNVVLQLTVVSETPSPTMEPEKTNTPTDTLKPSLTHTPIPSATATITPTVTNTPPPTPGPGLGTPFGMEKVYVIHLVKDGQSLGTLARLYDTTEDVIRAANAILSRRSAWPDDILVIPAGEKNPDNVRYFEYLFVGKKTDIQELADQYLISVDEIKELNNLGLDPWLPAGRWLIIPVPGE